MRVAHPATRPGHVAAAAGHVRLGQLAGRGRDRGRGRSGARVQDAEHAVAVAGRVVVLQFGYRPVATR